MKKGLSCLLLCVLIVLTVLLCVSVGSVSVPLADTAKLLFSALFGTPAPQGVNHAIILSVRLPRVLCVLLTGAALSLSGGAMQGLLRNPLADGSTLGVSSGAALGAIFALLLGVSFPGLPFDGSTVMAVLAAFLSMLLVISLSYALDRTLSTSTIILMGVILSMFASSLMSLLIAFSGEKLRSLTFWTLGSLSGSTYQNALLLSVTVLFFGGTLLLHARELNAFALGEEEAAHIGVNVRRVKLIVMVCVSALIGVSVSVGGTIGFVGLVVPHMTRLITGPDHKKLLPACMALGGIFLMLCDLAARTLLRPVELPIGVVTSLIGAVAFVSIYMRAGKAGRSL